MHTIKPLLIKWYQTKVYMSRKGFSIYVHKTSKYTTFWVFEVFLGSKIVIPFADVALEMAT